MNKGIQTVIDALERQGIAAEFANTKPQMKEDLLRVRLRFDREAMRFISDVRAALRDVVPESKTLVFTITAPIRLASKTTAVLDEKVRGALARRTARIDFAETIHGNQIRVRLLRGGVKSAAGAIGFVHNPETDPEILFDVTQSLLLGDGMLRALIC
jgi:hypothetical protein